MSFPKARVKRFNEISSCAPPVGHYDPKITESVNVPSLDTKDERFKEPKEVIKMRSSSLGSRNGKSVSNSSSVESIPKSICLTTHNSIKHSDKEKDLNKQLRQTVKERNSFYQKMTRKAEELSEVEKQLELVLEEKLKIEEEAESLREEVTRLKRDWAPKERDQDLNSDIKSHFQLVIGTLEQKIDELSLSQDNEHRLRLNLEKEMSSLKEEIAFLKGIIDSKDTKILSLQMLLNDSEKEAASERSKTEHLKSELEHLETEMQKLEMLAVARDSEMHYLVRSVAEKDENLRKSEERAASLAEEWKTKTEKMIEEHSDRLSFERNLASELREKLVRKEELLNELKEEIDDVVSQSEIHKQILVSVQESHDLEISSKEAQIRELVEMASSSDESKSVLAAKLEKLEMESKIFKLDLDKELSKKDDRIRELENQLNLEKRKHLLLEGQLSEREAESKTTVEILTRKLKESDRIHQSDFTRIGQLEGEVSELRKAVAARESVVWKLQAEVESLRCSEEETRRSFEEDCSFLLRQVDEHKAKLESADLEHRKLVGLLTSSKSEHDAKVCELARALEASRGEVKRIMKDHIELGKEHQNIIFDLQELRSSQESSSNSLKAFYQEELRRSHVEAENKMVKLKEECQRWKILYEEQNEKIEPFKELLEKYELEKQMLQNRNESVQKEVDKLNTKYADMFGHQNHKQKIQHLAKLKKENTSLKEDIAKLQAKDMMNRKRIEKLTGQLEALEGKKRFDPSTAFGLNRNHGGGDDDDEVNDRRVTYDIGRPASANLRSFPATRPRW